MKTSLKIYLLSLLALLSFGCDEDEDGTARPVENIVYDFEQDAAGW